MRLLSFPAARVLEVLGWGGLAQRDVVLEAPELPGGNVFLGVRVGRSCAATWFLRLRYWKQRTVNNCPTAPIIPTKVAARAHANAKDTASYCNAKDNATGNAHAQCNRARSNNCPNPAPHARQALPARATDAPIHATATIGLPGATPRAEEGVERVEEGGEEGGEEEEKG